MTKHKPENERIQMWKHLGQTAMFGDVRNPVVETLVRVLGDKPNAVRTALADYAKDAEANRPGQARMFGSPDAFDALNHTLGSKLSWQEFEYGLTEAAKTSRTTTEHTEPLAQANPGAETDRSPRVQRNDAVPATREKPECGGETTAREAMDGQLEKLHREGQVSPELYREAGGGSGDGAAKGNENPRGSVAGDSGQQHPVGEGSSGRLPGKVLDRAPAPTQTSPPSESQPANSAYREEVKAAQRRSLKENASLQKSNVIDIDGRKAVVLDGDGLAMWHRALQRFGKELGAGEVWRGMTLDEKNVNRAILILRAQAGSALLEPGGKTVSAGYAWMINSDSKRCEHP